MFTPQEIEEQTFEKAVFGGYDMQSVDEFLEPLTQDYVVLYKENAVIKSKMKVLVDKLEEYRSQEDSMKKALVAAQQTADNMISETQKKCARMISEAETTVGDKKAAVAQQLDDEQRRIREAQDASRGFIDRQIDLLRSQMQQLETLKTRKYELSESQKPAYEAEKDATAAKEDMAREIEQSLEKLVGDEPASASSMGDTRVMEPVGVSADARFADLQFGANYDPKRKSGKR